eukprot:4641626-Pyramimonas_sp.AAC.1
MGLCADEPLPMWAVPLGCQVDVAFAKPHRDQTCASDHSHDPRLNPAEPPTMGMPRRPSGPAADD